MPEPTGTPVAPPTVNATHDIVDGVTGKTLKHDSGDDPTQLIKVQVIGRAYYRREPGPGQNPLEVPMKRYQKGATLFVTPRALREAPNMLKRVDPVAVQPSIIGLTDVGGIGRSAAKMLQAAGINTLLDLKAATTVAVSRAAKVSESIAASWIQEATQLLEDLAAESSGTAEVIQGDSDYVPGHQGAMVPDQRGGAKSLRMTAKGGSHVSDVTPNATPPPPPAQVQ